MPNIKSDLSRAFPYLLGGAGVLGVGMVGTDLYNKANNLKSQASGYLRYELPASLALGAASFQTGRRLKEHSNGWVQKTSNLKIAAAIGKAMDIVKNNRRNIATGVGATGLVAAPALYAYGNHEVDKYESLLDTVRAFTPATAAAIGGTLGYKLPG